MVNGDGGLVLTKKEISSPARTLVREQYPSTHGQRYFVAGSTRVLVSIQSPVPCRSFSRAISMAHLPRGGRGSAPGWQHPARQPAAPRSGRAGECNEAGPPRISPRENSQN